MQFIFTDCSILYSCKFHVDPSNIFDKYARQQGYDRISVFFYMTLY